MENLFANSSDYGSISAYNAKWEEMVTTSHNNFDMNALRVNPQRKKMVMEYAEIVGEKIYWRSVEMYINPERLSMTNSKIKQKAYTRGGIFYHHWGSDHWTLQLTGYTGLATMDALLEIERLYEVSGKILLDTKDSLLIHKTESVDPVYPVGNLQKLIGSNGSSRAAVDVANLYGENVDNGLSNNNMSRSRSYGRNINQYGLAEVDYEKRKKELEKIKVSKSQPINQLTNNKICQNLTLIYKNIADSADLSAKINDIYKELNSYVSRKENRGEYMDFNAMYQKAQGLAKEMLSGYSSTLQGEVAYDVTHMLHIGYDNHMYDLAYVPGTNAMSTYVVNNSNLPEGVSSFTAISDSSTYSASSTYSSSSTYSTNLSNDVSNYTINNLPTNTSVDKIWEYGVDSASLLNKEIELVSRIFHGSNFDASSDAIKSELYNDSSLSWLWDEVKDQNRPRYIFIYFDGRVFIGHFDSFSWGRVAQHPLVNYELRFTVCHQIILKSVGDDPSPDEDRLIGILPKPPANPPPVPAPTPPPPTPAPTPTPPPAQEKPTTKTGVVVNCHKLNVRKGPGMSHSSFEWLSRGDKVTVIGKEGEWHKVTTASGKTGYVHQDFISIDGADINATSNSIKTGIVYNCSQLNIRNKPSDSGKVVGAFKAGDKVSILGEQSGWYKVQMGSSQGYSSKKYIKA